MNGQRLTRKLQLKQVSFAGNELADGDTVVVVKDLKVKGAGILKQGTRVKNIRLITGASDGHDIDCKIDGFGAMALKSEMVKKI